MNHAYLVLVIDTSDDLNPKIKGAFISSSPTASLTMLNCSTTYAEVESASGNSFEEASNSIMESVFNYPHLRWIMNFLY